MTERNEFIDFLRGFAMVVIILTHTAVFFPKDPVAHTLWNYSQFAVPVFLFCSAYLFLQNVDKPVNFFSYLKKRLQRLLVPYYIFLFLFLICLFIFTPHVVTLPYVLQSIFVIGGVDINWLVLLFIYITLLLPLVAWAYRRAKFIFWGYFFVSLGSSFYFLLHESAVSYKYIMWLPWSVMLYFTLFYLKFENRRKMLFGLLLLFVLLLGLTSIILNNHDLSTILRDNKYPPNIFYISFGTVVILGLAIYSKFLIKNKFIMNIFNFFSRHSYSIYFLHYTILTVLVVFMKQLHFNWFTLFLLVISLTFLFQYGFNVFKTRISS